MIPADILQGTIQLKTPPPAPTPLSLDASVSDSCTEPSRPCNRSVSSSTARMSTSAPRNAASSHARFGSSVMRASKLHAIVRRLAAAPWRGSACCSTFESVASADISRAKRPLESRKGALATACNYERQSGKLDFLNYCSRGSTQHRILHERRKSKERVSLARALAPHLNLQMSLLRRRVQNAAVQRGAMLQLQCLPGDRA